LGGGHSNTDPLTIDIGKMSQLEIEREVNLIMSCDNLTTEQLNRLEELKSLQEESWKLFAKLCFCSFVILPVPIYRGTRVLPLGYFRT